MAGTDTDVGKTFVCLFLARIFCELNLKVSVFKPIQTGNLNISQDLELIKKFCPDILITKSSYIFELPASPELASKDSEIQIDFEKIKQDLSQLEAISDIVIIEGAGGLFVPCGGYYSKNNNKIISDLINYLDAPCLLVSENKLGSINHTCLSLEHAKAKNIKILGFCFSGKKEKQENNNNYKILESNASLIEKYSGISYIGEFPEIYNISKFLISPEEQKKLENIKKFFVNIINIL